MIPAAMRVVVLLLATALTATPALADGCRGADGLPPPGEAPPAKEGEFRWVSGKGLGCVTGEAKALSMARGEAPLTFLPCLTVGGVAIGADIDDVEERLGAPARVAPVSEGTEARAYFIPQRGDDKPYHVVTYRLGKAVAVQLLGPPTVLPFTFSGLALGDGQQRVLDVLGPPARRCPGPRGAESWIWAPLPIGVDLRDGRVAGLKVTWPRH